MFTQYILPNGQQVTLVHRDIINANRTLRNIYRTPANLPSIPLPIDWTKNWTLQFPILGNDQYGCCMYDMAVHLDQSMTGNVGTESVYDANTVVQYYEKLSGGDNGLDESMITSEWTKGLCGNPSASILDSLDIDPTNDDLVNSAIYLFGGVSFMLSVPDKWINNFTSGAVWDAPASPDPRNGHGVAWNGVDAQNRKRLLTWGGYVWITPDGVKSCDPSAFTQFSLRWFDANGVAPNGLDYDQLAALWVQAGGKTLPPNPFKVDLPPGS